MFIFFIEPKTMHKYFLDFYSLSDPNKDYKMEQSELNKLLDFMIKDYMEKEKFLFIFKQVLGKEVKLIDRDSPEGYIRLKYKEELFERFQV